MKTIEKLILHLPNIATFIVLYYLEYSYFRIRYDKLKYHNDTGIRIKIMNYNI